MSEKKLAAAAMAGSGRITEFRHVTGTLVARLSNFDVAQDRLKSEHQNWLRLNVLGELRKGGSLWLIGLTSTTGPQSFNAPLSQRRAESVVAFLRKELPKGFPVKLETKLAPGKIPARIAGLADNAEDAEWRAVVVAVWNKPTPPPPPPPPPKPVPDECKRTVLLDKDGVDVYAVLNQPNHPPEIINQVWKVKASPGYLKCATDFERRSSFLAKGSGSHPVILEYARDPGSNILGEVLGHLVWTTRNEIFADTEALKRLPRPYYTGGNGFDIYRLPVEALLNGYLWTQNDNDLISLSKVPLFVGRPKEGSYFAIGYSSEDAESYEVVTDVFGQIGSIHSKHASRYPKSDSNLSIGIKTVVTQTIKTFVKTLLF